MISVTSVLYGVDPDPIEVLSEKIINSFSIDNPLSSYPLQNDTLARIAEDNWGFEDLIITEPDEVAFSYYHTYPEKLDRFVYKYICRYHNKIPLIDVFKDNKLIRTLRYNLTLIYRVTNFKKFTSEPSELDLIYLDLFNTCQCFFLEDNLVIAAKLIPFWVGNTPEEANSKSVLRYLFCVGSYMPGIFNAPCGYDYGNGLTEEEIDALDIMPIKLIPTNDFVTVKKLCWYGSSEEEVDLKTQFDLFDVTDTDSSLHTGNIVRYLDYYKPVYLKLLTQKEYDEVEPYLKCVEDLK